MFDEFSIHIFIWYSDNPMLIMVDNSWFTVGWDQWSWNIVVRMDWVNSNFMMDRCTMMSVSVMGGCNMSIMDWEGMRHNNMCIMSCNMMWCYSMSIMGCYVMGNNMSLVSNCMVWDIMMSVMCNSMMWNIVMNVMSSNMVWCIVMNVMSY